MYNADLHRCGPAEVPIEIIWHALRSLLVGSACSCWCVQGSESYTSEEEQGGDPPRLWAPGASWPGTAFTRSIGDSGEALSKAQPDAWHEPDLMSCRAT